MNPAEFARRRRQLLRMIGRGGIGILPASPAKVRSRDVEYPYRQDSDFYYLTGFAEPEAVAVLVPGRPAGEYLLFCRERDAQREVWDGPRCGPEQARERFGADQALPMARIDSVLPGLLQQADRVHYTRGMHPDFDARLDGWMASLRHHASPDGRGADGYQPMEDLLHDLRLYKSRAEVSTLRRAADVAVQAHLRAMARCRPGLWEYEIEAEFLHEFRRRGARPSYLPIVGSGPNACVLHYIANDRQMQAGELLLVDVGCECDYYASDVTRTYPVDGRFSPEQRGVYEVVLEAQEAALEQIGPGRHWNDPHDAAVRAIVRGLRRLGLLEGSPSALIRTGEYKRFFMHRTGHWLGMDVHDVGDYRVGDHWRLLEPGMVMTVEPGLYVAPGSRGVDRRWWGIGVRIEDDVLVTKDGHDVLTGALPRAPAELEALIGAAA
jgi:Xaa-Pro aminopeptidase